MSRIYKQVDVFSNTKYKGNPLAVYFDADHLSDDEMSQIANWHNLSETTFVLKPTVPEAHYQVRIFTPAGELPFAGHPTIGTCHALIELGVIKKDDVIFQQCKAGLVSIEISSSTDSPSIKFKLLYHHISPIVPSNQEVEEALNLPQNSIKSGVLVDDGPKWATFEIASGELVRDCKPNFDLIKSLSAKYDWCGIGIIGRYNNKDSSFELRNFCPVEGVDEDPACGSGAGAAGALLAQELQVNDSKNLNFTQGINLGRDAKLKVNVSKDHDGNVAVYVGGQAVTVINGTY